MKKEGYTDIICKGFCRFYNEGKEETSCGTYRFLADRFTAHDLANLIPDLSKVPEYFCDEEVRKLICPTCDFLVDGCDFREGADAPPCGGYSIIEGLVAKGQLSL
jgi:hypothetical protein